MFYVTTIISSWLLTSWLGEWHTFGPLVFFNVMRNRISGYLSKVRIKVGLNLKVREDFGWSLLFLRVPTRVFHKTTRSLSAQVQSFLVTSLKFFRKSLTQTCLNLSDAQSNDVLQPTTIGLKCAVPVVNTCFYTGLKVCHPLSQHSI